MCVCCTLTIPQSNTARIPTRQMKCVMRTRRENLNLNCSSYEEDLAENLKMSIYFDYNATTPLATSVVKRICQSLESHWGNPSSSYTIGRTAKQTIEEARLNVAKMLNANCEEIIFTSGGTEANNIVIFGIPNYYSNWIATCSKPNYCTDDTVRPHVITTNVEHDAVILPLKNLQSKGKIDLTEISVYPNGCVSVEDILAQIKPETCFITVMQANNETGAIMPVIELGRALKKCNKERELQGFIRILYHTDSAQAIGKIEVKVDELCVDYLTIVGHKFYGPRIGALYVRGLGNSTYIEPMMYGGGQERGWRPGTENTPLIAGLGEAARLVFENFQSYHDHMLMIRDYLEEKLIDTFGKDGVKLNCSQVDRLPNTSNISLIGNELNGHRVLSHCQFLMASTGAACHSQNKPSKILLASGIEPKLAANSIRLSVGRDSSYSDVDMILSDLKQAVEITKQNS